MTKLTSLEGKRKKPAPCRHCGREPACPDLTCPRLKSFGEDGDGYVQYEYITQESPREIHLHFHGMSAEEAQALTEQFSEPEPEPEPDGPKAA